MIKSLGEKKTKRQKDNDRFAERTSDVSTGLHAHCHHPGSDNHHLTPFKDRASLSLRKGEPDFIFTGNDRSCNMGKVGSLVKEKRIMQLF